METKVLVIDDEQDMRVYLANILQEHGYSVVMAADGFEGIEIAKSERPALVVLDLVMPIQSGTDFYRKFSRDPDLSEIPVIVVSGVAGRDLAVKRPVAVFDKPIDPDRFIDAVKKAIG